MGKVIRYRMPIFAPAVGIFDKECYKVIKRIPGKTELS
jgi:hypothetical protein